MVRVHESKGPSAPATLELSPPRQARLLALVLLVVWAATAIAVAAAYRPGGPIDLIVILACSPPVFVAAVGLLRPPVARDHRGRILVAWLWIAALLFAIPVLYGVASTLAAGGPQNLVPSAEAAYAGLVALFVMSVFSLLGYVHARRRVPVIERRAALHTLALATLATIAIGSAFGMVAFVNDQALRPEVPATSPYGPTDPEVVPPLCDEPVALGPNARIHLEARSVVDDVERGRAALEGRRRGRDEAWGARWEGPDAAGAAAYLRVGRDAWLNTTSDDPGSPGTTWRSVPPDPFGLAGARELTMDGPPHAVVDVPRGTIIAEDLGLELLDGARARHCRTFIDGPTALSAFLPLRWLLAGDFQVDPDELVRWRGELDWWVFGDGQLGRVSVVVSGARTDTPWETDGLRAALEAELDALDRRRRVEVTVPRLEPGADELQVGETRGLPPALESARP